MPEPRNSYASWFRIIFRVVSGLKTGAFVVGGIHAVEHAPACAPAN